MVTSPEHRATPTDIARAAVDGGPAVVETASREELLILQVLHGLRLKGFVSAAVLAGALEAAEPAVEAVLQGSAARGHTQFRDGTRSGWSLTAAGRVEGERLLAEELDRSGHRPAVEDAYHRFLQLNPQMLAVCTDWQVKDQSAQLLNDHEDAAYDRAVIDRLGEIHAAVVPICAELTAMLDRFAGYGPRLDTAIGHLRPDRDGPSPEPRAPGPDDRVWFTSPTIDSYHTVWFELHEDLLATLGIDRASERS